MSQLMHLINKEFILILSIASLIGSVAGFYLFDTLMDSIFAYCVDLNAVTFSIPLLTLFFISILTIGHKVYKAAVANPVKSLRYE